MSGSVWRDNTRPVVSQMSAQSRFRRMQRTSISTCFSPRQASAHAVGLRTVETRLDAVNECSAIHLRGLRMGFQHLLNVVSRCSQVRLLE